VTKESSTGPDLAERPESAWPVARGQRQQVS